MPYDDLSKLLKPPTHPVDAKGDWRSVEKKLGTKLPPDYVSFIERYGSGSIASFLRIWSPFAPSNEDLLVCSTKAIQALGAAADNVHAFFPEPQGLLPVGVTDNGDTIAWRTKGRPDQWTVVVHEGRGPEFYDFKGSLTAFLSSVLSKKTRCPIFPEDFPGRDCDFVPKGRGRHVNNLVLRHGQMPLEQRIEKARSVMPKGTRRGKLNPGWVQFYLPEKMELQLSEASDRDTRLQALVWDPQVQRMKAVIREVAGALGAKIERCTANFDGKPMWSDLLDVKPSKKPSRRRPK
jgi:hypothetical protein